MPDARPATHQQQNFEIARRRILEVDGHHLLNVLALERVRQVLPHMRVQVIGVGPRQAGCQAQRGDPCVRRATLHPRQPCPRLPAEQPARQLAGSVQAQQHNPDEPSAVQIGPQHRQHREPPQQLGVVVLPHALQNRIENHREQQREQVRPRQEMNRRAGHRQERERHGDQRIPALAERQPEHQGGGQRDNQGAPHHHRRQPPVLMQPGEDYVPQPLPRKPRLSRLSKREQILVGHPAVTHDPLAGAHMPSGVAVAQQCLGAVHARKDENEGHQKREVRHRRQNP